MRMLEYTFQHLPGYGDVKEKELWKRNIHTWDDYDRIQQKQLQFEFGNVKSAIQEARDK
jgi:hypothetical protein